MISPNRGEHKKYLKTQPRVVYCSPKNPGMSDWKGITPIHSYSFQMGLEPAKSYDREGSGVLGVGGFHVGI